MITTTDFDNKYIFLKKGVGEIINTPVRCNHLAIIFVKCGEMKIEINYSVYNVKQNSLVLLSPLDIVTIKDSSDDYDSITLVVPVSLFTNSSNLLNVDFDFYEKIKWQPATTFYDRELDILNRIFDIMQSIYTAFDYDNFEQSGLSCVQILFQLYHSHLKKSEGYSRGIKSFESRKKALFRKFVKELVTSHNKSREVLFYANELGVSSGYLNEVCNEVSNYSAKEIIDTAVSSRLKYELSYTDKSIQELADEYNFPSQSYFSRYYKRLTGVSPSDFRKNIQKKE